MPVVSNNWADIHAHLENKPSPKEKSCSPVSIPKSKNRKYKYKTIVLFHIWKSYFRVFLLWLQILIGLFSSAQAYEKMFVFFHTCCHLFTLPEFILDDESARLGWRWCGYEDDLKSVVGRHQHRWLLSSAINTYRLWPVFLNNINFNSIHIFTTTFKKKVLL